MNQPLTPTIGVQNNPTRDASGRRLRLGELLNQAEWPDGYQDERVSGEFAERVRAAIAERWHTDAETVVLCWPSLTGQDIDSHTTFRLAGDGADGWFPLVIENEGEPGSAVRLRAGISAKTPITNRDLLAGACLEPRDIDYRTVVSWGKPATSVRPSVAPGWILVGDVEAGTDLDRSNATPTAVIRAGDTVRLSWSVGGVSATLEGTAQHEAAPGDRVTVRVRGRNRVVRGTVLSRGQVRLQV